MYINQNTKLNGCLLNTMLDKYGKYTAKFDKSTIEYDLNLIKEKLEAEKRKLERKSYTEIIKYLSKLLKIIEKCSNDGVEISFETDDRKIGGFPIETIKIDEPQLKLKLEYLDYVSLDGSATVIRVNYNHLMRGLALELARDDLGLSIEEVEDALENTSLVSVNSSDMLEQFMEDEDLSRVIASFKVGESEYVDKITKEAKNYYLDKVKDNKTYAEIMDSTMKKTIAYITCEILTDFSDLNISEALRVIAVYNDEIVFAVPDKLEESILDIINRPVCALILGRKFVFSPKIRILEREHREGR